MLKHQIVINIRDPAGNEKEVVNGADVMIRNKILDFIFGKKQKMLVLFPSESVESVAIREVKENE